MLIGAIITSRHVGEMIFTAMVIIKKKLEHAIDNTKEIKQLTWTRGRQERFNAA